MNKIQTCFHETFETDINAIQNYLNSRFYTEEVMSYRNMFGSVKIMVINVLNTKCIKLSSFTDNFTKLMYQNGSMTS